MPENKPLADQAEPKFYVDDDHPAWDPVRREPLRRGSRVAGLHWVPGTRLVAGVGQAPVCPHAAGIDISELGPCPLDVKASEELSEKPSDEAEKTADSAPKEITSEPSPATDEPAPAGE